MKRNLLILSLSFLFLFQGNVKADEGMWLPYFLGKKYQEMKALGLSLTQEQLYDINHASLKDAIVMLDGGNCTGEIISSQGLLLTNHHCGYGEIQAHSSVEHDYLTDGFWAYSLGEELVNPGKTASFLVRIEDVTAQVLKEVKATASEQEREQAIQTAIAKLEKDAVKGTHYEAQVANMFEGNEFYLFVYETFRDVRLVGAPPSSIGKFGGDTDNWIWPRHTGDFSMFRVYMGKDGKPADYSPENVPYQPKHYLPVSVKGVKENDFAMIWGYPGSTDRYLSSYGVVQKSDELNPVTVKLREKKMEIMKNYMDQDAKIRIQYAEKYAYLGNFWKKDREESKALRRLKVADQKKALETEFLNWSAQGEDRSAKYGEVISTFEKAYKVKSDSSYSKAWWYIIEASFFQGSEILTFALKHNTLKGMLTAEKDATAVIDELKGEAAHFYKDFNPTIDKEILGAMLQMYHDDLPAELHPEFFKMVEKKFKGNFNAYAEMVFKKSVFANEEKYMNFLSNPKKQLEKEPAMEAIFGLFAKFQELQMAQNELDTELQKAKRLFIDGIRQMNDQRFYYPDANSTMRLTYGTVRGYEPRDAVKYDFITYLEGVIQKEDPTNEEFVVPAKLKELYAAKDFGTYTDNGKVPVCFLTNHDITGGNSGSPVINANGELIGTAFDGNADAMSSDIQFDPKLQRTIVCDIRYVLFVMDKMANAQNLIKELEIRN
ncbi:MAG: S46 family peptidase [Bacteroidales bacterium]|nr:S46 family peptidase [Bacteroidales bacterium]